MVKRFAILGPVVVALAGVAATAPAQAQDTKVVVKKTSGHAMGTVKKKVVIKHGHGGGTVEKKVVVHRS